MWVNTFWFGFGLGFLAGVAFIVAVATIYGRRKWNGVWVTDDNNQDTGNKQMCHKGERQLLYRGGDRRESIDRRPRKTGIAERMGSTMGRSEWYSWQSVSGDYSDFQIILLQD